MKLISLLAASVLALGVATAHAAERFSALEGIDAEVMNSQEMDAVQGKYSYYNDFLGGNLFDPSLYGAVGTDFYGSNLGGGLYEQALANMAFDQAHANDPAIIASLWLQEAQYLRSIGYTGPIDSPPTFAELFPNAEFQNQQFINYIRQ